jgi:carnitine O-acetyltransferase
VKELQARLKKRAEDEGHDNWLSDLYNQWAYMGAREPLIPFSSYYIAHKPDHRWTTGAKRASGLVRAILEFRNLVETYVFPCLSLKVSQDSQIHVAKLLFSILSFREQLEPDFARSVPLCMGGYRWLFNSCRYPLKPSDTAKKFDPQVNNHLVVIRKGQFFEFSVTKPDGSWLSAAELES